MAKVSTNISIDPKLKEKSIALFSEFGLDLSTAISLFLQQCVREKRIPFEIRLEVPNEITKEALSEFEEMKKDQGRMAEDSAWKSRYPQFMEKYDEVTYSEKNRDRYEYRNYKIINDASFVSKTEKQWPFLKSVGCAEQIRILIVKDEDGNDITPSKEQFLREGSVRQPAPLKGDGESTDIQVVGIISDKEMSAEEMGWCKRNHWSVENRLHHVLDDTFREDRSPARGSRNNLALIRKFALNVLRLVQIQTGNRSPISEMMDLLNDDSELLGRYVFGPIESLY